MATEVLKTIDPDNAGGTDYTSLDAWEDALGGTTTGHLPIDDQIAIAECRSSGGTDDTTPIDITGWTTDVTRYILITGNSAHGDGDGDFPSDGVFDGTKYVLAGTNEFFLQCRENYTRFDKLQIQMTVSGTSTGLAFNVVGIVAGGSDIHIDSCIFKGICSGTGAGYGIYIGDADATLNIFNTVVYGFRSGNDAAFMGIRVVDSTLTKIYNCTVSGCYRGIRNDAGTTNIINCVNFNNFDDIHDNGGTVTIDYCATDEGAGEGNNGVDISGTWDTTCFTDPEASPPDFSVQDVDSPIYEAGDKTTPIGLFSVDIIGTTRKTTWDIGAFELAAAPAGNAGIMTTNTGYWGPTF